MKYNQFKRVFWKELKRRIGGELLGTEEYFQFLGDFTRYFYGIAINPGIDSKFDLSKGLYVFSPPGTGKSTVFYAMKTTLALLKAKGVPVKVELKPLTALELGAKIVDMFRDKSINFLELVKYNYIDDFMRENIDGRLTVYGTKIIPAVTYIENIYRYRQRIFITSNFPPQHLLTFSDDLYHAVSRIYEMCNVVKINAEDFRLARASLFEY